jgi:putative glutamine amidotransferase
MDAWWFKEAQVAVVVGVTSRKSDPAWLERWTGNYVMRLEELGLTAVILAPDAVTHLPSGAAFEPDHTGRFSNEILRHLDGVVFAGGGDVHPRHFGQTMDGAEDHSIDERRDAMELALVRDALAHEVPIFGICRGCQVINVALGGGMIQHVEGHRSSTEAVNLHSVDFAPGTQLAQIVGDARIRVNTYHHQVVDLDTLAPGLKPAVFDGHDRTLIEAYELPAHRWAIGVQWHPERIQDFDEPEPQRRLWSSFAQACALHNAERSHRVPGDVAV